MRGAYNNVSYMPKFKLGENNKRNLFIIEFNKNL